MRNLILAAALLLPVSGAAMAVAPKPTQRPTTIAGIRWEPSLAAAETRARKEHKPVLYLSLFGRLDEDLC